MYTIVEIKNKQYKLEVGKPALIDRLDAEENSEIEIKKVLLLAGKENEIKVGKPYIRGLTLKAKVLGNTRGKKIRVFKYKKRKDYRRTIGSRPVYTRILLEKVGT
jgi:large subunit ribosomal protein L21